MKDPLDEQFRTAMHAAGATMYDDELAPERPPGRWRRRARRWGVNLASAPLYAVQWLWDYRWDVVWILACVSVAAYWLTAWAFMIIDRMGY